jgi:hypothetical protein
MPQLGRRLPTATATETETETDGLRLSEPELADDQQQARSLEHVAA